MTDFAKPFKVIGHAFKFIGEHIASGFVALFGKDAAHNFAQAAVEVLKTDLGKIAMSVVAALMTLNADGASKRAEAFKQIVEQAKASGIDAGESIVNLLIELAVAAIKQNFIQVEPNA